MITAKLSVRTNSRPMSISLIRAVGPDNMKMPGLTVKAHAKPTTASFDVQFEGRIETFISTLDDLLQCLQAAKGTLDRIAS